MSARIVAVFKGACEEIFKVSVAAGWAMSSVFVAAAGPFGTFGTHPFWWVLLYWAALIGIAIVLGILFRVFFRIYMSGLKPWGEHVAAAAALALVFGPMILWVNRSLTGDASPGGLGLVHCIAVVFAMAISTVILRRVMTLGDDPQVTVAQDKLLQRLSLPDDVRIKAVSSDNHHIRILTDDGQSHRILMRLRDAVNEIDRELGFCIHRSHWVAQDAIERLHQQDGREVVVLSCGAQLPVGPKYRDNLVRSGHITGGGILPAEPESRAFR